MKRQLALYIFITLSITGVSAEPHVKKVDSTQQATRDNEKLQILLNELNEQRIQAAQLNQQKALVLLSGKQDEIAKVEAGLTEVNENIMQIQQEINLAQGNPATIQPVAIRQVKATKAEDTTASGKVGVWWDFYGRKARQ
jgi:hypothetical protein